MAGPKGNEILKIENNVCRMDFSTQARVLLHPARAQIYALLSEAPLTVREIAAELPDIPVASAYRHLAMLKESGFVQRAESPPDAPREVRYVAAPPEPLFTTDQREQLQPDQLVVMVHALTEMLRARFARFSASHPFPLQDGDVSCMVRSLRLTPEELQSLRHLVQELVARSESRGGEEWSERTVGFFSVPDGPA